MNRIITLSLLCFSILWAGSSQAIMIGFNPSSTNIGVGSAFSVDVVASDLGSEIVSGFSLDIVYDSSVLVATGVAFGSELNGGIPFFSFQSSFNDQLSSPGISGVTEVSLLPDFVLAGIQSYSVTLATLSFTAMTVGGSALDFMFSPVTHIVGSGAQALPLTVAPGNVTVAAQSVPEPATYLLLLTGFLGLVLRSNSCEEY